MKYSHHSHSSVLKEGLFPQYDEFLFSVSSLYEKKKWHALKKMNYKRVGGYLSTN